MAILNAKQRKELSDSEFGLPEERRFPLTDKQHVLKAIQFFKYCPDDKKKTLAKNINSKAREYGMKINTKGSFARYASPDIIKHANEAFGYDVVEASNMGTLAPIVGGVPQESIHREEFHYDEDDIDQFIDEVVLKDGLKYETIEAEEGFIVANLEVIASCPLMDKIQKEMYGYASNKSPKSNRDELYAADRIYNTFNYKYENSNINYLLLSFLNEGDNFLQYDYIVKDGNAYHNLMERKRYVIELLTSDDFAGYTIKEVIDHIKSILYASKEINDFRYLLTVVYSINKLLFMILMCELVKDNHKGEPFYVPNLVTPSIVDSFLHKHQMINISEGFPNMIISDLENIARKWDFDKCDQIIGFQAHVSDMLSSYPIILQNLSLLRGKYFDEYACFDIGRFNKAYFILKEKNKVYKVIPLKADSGIKFAYYQVGYIHYDFHRPHFDLMVDMYQKFLRAQSPEEITERFPFRILGEETRKVSMEASTIAKMKNRLNDMVRGFHITNDGDVRINLQNKLTFEHYEEIHKILKENARSGNYEAMKENLAYIFALIGTIEKLYMSEQNRKNKTYIAADPEYQSMIRLRALLISDFKVYMRVLLKHDRNFNFLEYYNQSEVNRSVYVVKKNEIQNAARLLRSIML